MAAHLLYLLFLLLHTSTMQSHSKLIQRVHTIWQDFLDDGLSPSVYIYVQRTTKTVNCKCTPITQARFYTINSVLCNLRSGSNGQIQTNMNKPNNFQWRLLKQIFSNLLWGIGDETCTQYKDKILSYQINIYTERYFLHLPFTVSIVAFKFSLRNSDVYVSGS
jgi:hypothetical protein